MYELNVIQAKKHWSKYIIHRYIARENACYIWAFMHEKSMQLIKSDKIRYIKHEFLLIQIFVAQSQCQLLDHMKLYSCATIKFRHSCMWWRVCVSEKNYIENHKWEIFITLSLITLEEKYFCSRSDSYIVLIRHLICSLWLNLLSKLSYSNLWTMLCLRTMHESNQSWLIANQAWLTDNCKPKCKWMIGYKKCCGQRKETKKLTLYFSSNYHSYSWHHFLLRKKKVF